MRQIEIAARVPITTLEQWRRFGGPQRDYQWKRGCSAMECARAWLGPYGPRVPSELDALFASHALTRGLAIARASPEIETRLDGFGKGRNHDVVAWGDGPAGRTVVCVEAKTNEAFGPLVSEAMDEAGSRSKSNLPRRVEQLARAVLGRDVVDVRDLRYQLLHAVAGTLIEARAEGAALAVFVVHELGASAEKSAAHRHDLDRFLGMLSGDEGCAVRHGRLLGPFLTPGAQPGEGLVPGGLPLLVGIASRDVDD